MKGLALVLLLAPATLSAQEPAYNPATLMAQAIDHLIKSTDSTAVRMRRMRDLGFPGTIPAHLLEKEKYTFKLSTKIPPGVTENATLTSAIATRLGIATTDPATEERACSQVPYPPERGIPGTFPVCRYTRTDRVVTVSLPVVSGDTARVELWESSNSTRPYNSIATIIQEVTLVRTGNAWNVVSRLTVRTLH